MMLFQIDLECVLFVRNVFDKMARKVNSRIVSSRRQTTKRCKRARDVLLVYDTSWFDVKIGRLDLMRIIDGFEQRRKQQHFVAKLDWNVCVAVIELHA